MCPTIEQCGIYGDGCVRVKGRVEVDTTTDPKSLRVPEKYVPAVQAFENSTIFVSPDREGSVTLIQDEWPESCDPVKKELVHNEEKKHDPYSTLICGDFVVEPIPQ